MREPSLFAVDERLTKLSDIGNQLEAYGQLVNFGIFRPVLDNALVY